MKPISPVMSSSSKNQFIGYLWGSNIVTTSNNNQEKKVDFLKICRRFVLGQFKGILTFNQPFFIINRRSRNEITFKQFCLAHFFFFF